MICMSPNKYFKLITSINLQKNFTTKTFSTSNKITYNLIDSNHNNIIKRKNSSPNFMMGINNVKYYSTTINKDKSSDDPNLNDPNRKPSLEQLVNIEERMKLHLPKFLKEMHPYGLYTTDVIFENSYYKDPPKKTVGALLYAIELLKIRWKINVKFSNAVVQLLKVTHDEENGTVKIRWRMRGLRGMKILQPWKIRIWDLNESIKTEAEWHDGFSILYIQGDGRIYKHILQRVMTNEDEVSPDKKNIKKLMKKLNVASPSPTLSSRTD